MLCQPNGIEGARHECHFCEKSYKTKKGLDRHMRFECSVSSGSQRFKCPYCQHESKRKDNLRQHILTHLKRTKKESYNTQTMTMNYYNDGYWYVCFFFYVYSCTYVSNTTTYTPIIIYYIKYLEANWTNSLIS